MTSADKGKMRIPRQNKSGTASVDRFAEASAALDSGHFGELQNTGVPAAPPAASTPATGNVTVRPGRRTFTMSYSGWPEDAEHLESMKHRLYMAERIKLSTSAAVRMALATLAAKEDHELLAIYHKWADQHS